MTTSHEEPGQHGPGHEGPGGAPDRAPTADELRELSDFERSRVGARLDDIEIASREEPFPVPGTKAEKRAERTVAACFLLTFVATIAFTVIYVAWPWEYKDKESSFFSYWTYTPALGITMALALFGLAAGIILWGKLLMVHEEAVERRHDGFSEEVDRQTATGTVRDTVAMTGLGRRAVIRRSLGLAGGAIGVLAIVPLGGLVKKPKGELFRTPWREGVRLVRDDAARTPMRPQDMQPGSLQTVFPDVEDGTKAADAPVMLIRLRPGQKIRPRRGQEDFPWEDYVAFSKICTHAGCPVSLYEQQTGRILCPCHQSQFDVMQDAKPVFGPATRSLPMLPITVDDEGYFVARGDFREAIGPAFWERS